MPIVCVGEGGFGKVVKIWHKKDMEYYALKKLKYLTIKEKFRADKEVEMLSKIKML